MCTVQLLVRLRLTSKTVWLHTNQIVIFVLARNLLFIQPRTLTSWGHRPFLRFGSSTPIKRRVSRKFSGDCCQARIQGCRAGPAPPPPLKKKEIKRRRKKREEKKRGKKKRGKKGKKERREKGGGERGREKGEKERKEEGEEKGKLGIPIIGEKESQIKSKKDTKDTVFQGPKSWS